MTLRLWQDCIAQKAQSNDYCKHLDLSHNYLPSERVPISQAKGADSITETANGKLSDNNLGTSEGDA
jgi:hypothetical protein